MIKNVFFDFDGVLTFQGEDAIQTCKSLEKITKIEYSLLFEEYSKYVPDLMRGALSHLELCETLSSKFDYEFSIELFKQAFLETTVNDKIFDLIRELKHLGVKIGLITDNSLERIEALSELFFLDELFDFKVISGSIGKIKHEKEPFRLALELSKSFGDGCLFVDDHKANLDIAKELNFDTIYYDSNVHDVSYLKNRILEEIDGLE